MDRHLGQRTLGGQVIRTVQQAGEDAAQGHVRKGELFRQGAVKLKRQTGLGEEVPLDREQSVEQTVRAVVRVLFQLVGHAVENGRGPRPVVLLHEGIGCLQLVANVVADAGGVF